MQTEAYTTIFHQLIHNALLERSISEPSASETRVELGHFDYMTVT